MTPYINLPSEQNGSKSCYKISTHPKDRVQTTYQTEYWNIGRTSGTNNNNHILATLSEDLRNANISSIFKKRDWHSAASYRMALLTSVPCKLCEHIICWHLKSIKHWHRSTMASNPDIHIKKKMWYDCQWDNYPQKTKMTQT